MMKFICLVIKLAIFGAIFLWLDFNPNGVNISWRSYQINTTLDMLFAATTALFIVLYFLIRLWKTILNLPQRFKERSKLKNYHNSAEAIYALIENIFLEGGNDPIEIAETFKKNKDLESLAPFVSILTTPGSEITFETPRESKASVLYLYHRAKTNLTQGNWPQAFEYLASILQKRPESQWALRQIIPAARNSHKFDEALKYTDKALKYEGLSRAEYNHTKAEILYEEVVYFDQTWKLNDKIHKLSQAHELDIGNGDIAIQLALNLKANDQIKYAKKCLQESWDSSPSPRIALLYLSLTELINPIDLYEKIKELTCTTPHHPLSLLLGAQYALKAKIWGEARNYLAKLENLHGLNPQAYLLKAKLELSEHQDKTKYLQLLEIALEKTENIYK